MMKQYAGSLLASPELLVIFCLFYLYPRHSRKPYATKINAEATVALELNQATKKGIACLVCFGGCIFLKESISIASYIETSHF